MIFWFLCRGWCSLGGVYLVVANLEILLFNLALLRVDNDCIEFLLMLMPVGDAWWLVFLLIVLTPVGDAWWLVFLLIVLTPVGDAWWLVFC